MKNINFHIYFLFNILFFTMGICQISDSSSFYLQKGDDAYNNFDNDSALFFYTKSLEKDSNNYEAAWKLSRAYVDVGEIQKDKVDRKQFYLNGEKYAKLAIKINPNGSKGYLSASIAIGRVALDAGKKEQVKLSKDVKTMVDKSLELNPNDDTAWHVLGRWNRKMATLGWIQKKFADMFLGGIPKDASLENAKNCFLKSIELNPNNIRHHFELALTYEKLKEKNLALEEYEKVLALPVSDVDDPEMKLMAEKKLEKLN